MRSALTVALGLGLAWLVAGCGLPSSRDFTSGTRVAVAFASAPPDAELRAAVADAGYPDARIEPLAEVADSGRSGFLIQMPALDSTQQEAFRSAIDQRLAIAVVDGTGVWSSETVTVSFAQQTRTSLLLLVVVLILVAVLVYILARRRPASSGSG